MITQALLLRIFVTRQDSNLGNEYDFSVATVSIIEFDALHESHDEEIRSME
jgi:hypothetical protein